MSNANNFSPNSNSSSGEDTLANTPDAKDCTTISPRSSYGFGDCNNNFIGATPSSAHPGEVNNDNPRIRLQGRPTLASNANTASHASSRVARPTTSRNANQRTYSQVPHRPRLAPYRRNGTGQPQLVWTDADYHRENPWYNSQQSSKPIFSLGGPLPHVVRRHRRGREPARVMAKLDEETGSVEDLVEEEDVLEDGDSVLPERQHTQRTASNQPERVATHGSTATRDAQVRQARSTAAGVAHTDRRNDAGQPVFDYIPRQSEQSISKHETRQSGLAQNESSRSKHRQTTSDGRTQSNAPPPQPEFKIDGEPLGQQECSQVEQGEKDPNDLRNWWARIRARYPEPLAELLATSVAVFLGLAASLSVTLSMDQPAATKYGDYETSCWAWGFAWMFGIYLGGGVSGAHMNPAISISLSLFRGFPWRQCAVYVVAQFAGGLAAGGMVYGLFADSVHHVDPELTGLAGAFFSTPREWVSPRSAFANQVAGSAVQMMAVLALGDDQNNPPGAGMHALIIGLLVTTTKWTLGYNIGSALNPASDFGPRVVAWAAGCRDANVFRSMWWLYGPWVATVLGSVVGCIFYDSCVFVGTESPVNYRWGDVWRHHSKSFTHGFFRRRRRT